MKYRHKPKYKYAALPNNNKSGNAVNSTIKYLYTISIQNPVIHLRTTRFHDFKTENLKNFEKNAQNHEIMKLGK